MWWPQTMKPITRDRDRAAGDEPVAEDALVRGGGDQLADHAHRRQHHDVDGRVAVEPEQVLEQQRIAAERRVEDAEAEHPLRATSTSVIVSTGVASTKMIAVA